MNDIAEILAEQLNFTLSFSSPSDLNWGNAVGKDDLGQEIYNGVVGDLQFGRADMCSSALTMTTGRYRSCHYK